MPRTVFLGTGHYVPDRVVTNHDLAQKFETSDAWVRQRTGVVERRHVDFDNAPMGSAEMGARAGARAIEAAGITQEDIDLVIFATLSPDKEFPGCGCLAQAHLDIPGGVPALDIRNQCSGFLYGLSVADAFIKAGTYRHVLLIGAECHSSGLEFSDRGRDVTVIFGDGGAAVVLGASDEPDRGVLSVHLHADGRYAEELHVSYPASNEMPRLTPEGLAEGRHYPRMNGRNVFKHAVVRMPEAVGEALKANGLTTQDIDLLIPHQANLRIAEMVQQRLELSSERVYNNIQKYGNTTAASIPLALDEVVRAGRLKSGDVLCLTAFGAGFTWGSALIRW